MNTDTGTGAVHCEGFLTDTGFALPASALVSGSGRLETIPVGGSTIIETADAAAKNLTEGWARVREQSGNPAARRYSGTIRGARKQQCLC